MERGLLFIKKKKPLQLYFYYLIWVVTSRQAVNGIMQTAEKAAERRRDSFRGEKEEKQPPNATHYSSPLEMQTP